MGAVARLGASKPQALSAVNASTATVKSRSRSRVQWLRPRAMSRAYIKAANSRALSTVTRGLPHAARMTIQVIGAGFGRTGTDSMREALDILGFGPCHHMFEVNAHEEQKRLWRALAKGAAP